MALIILGGVVFTLAAAWRISLGSRKAKAKIHTPKNQIKRLDTLLHNVEVYDGTAKGQKRMELK